MEWSSTQLRVLRAVAEHGSFTAAASRLGYTQSAVSRQVAALERATEARLFERRAGGAHLTAAGSRLLRHASAALDELDRVERVLHGSGPDAVRLRVGVFESVGAALLPRALSLMHERRPDVDVISREGSTAALIRGLRAATLDLAVIASRPPYTPPDDEEPPLELDVLLEGDLVIAVPARGDIGLDGTVSLEELQGASWISSTQSASEFGMGLWPALARRPAVVHYARGWLAKLELVASGHGVTTVPPILAAVAPPGVRLVRVSDGAPVTRRALMARRSGDPDGVQELAECLMEAAGELALD